MNASTELQPGSKYHKLTVVEFSHKDKRHRRYYKFRCDCGAEKVIHGTAVTSGNTKSCGCYGVESRKSKRMPDNQGVINHIILQYKRHARDRGLSWSLTYEQVAQIIQEPCFYCGTMRSNHKVTKNCKEGYDHNGIDRVDSSIGYEPDNVVSCCKICNYAKSDMPQKDFILWAQLVATKTRAMATQWAGQAEKFAASDCNREAAQENLSTASISDESEVVK